MRRTTDHSRSTKGQVAWYWFESNSWDSCKCIWYRMHSGNQRLCELGLSGDKDERSATVSGRKKLSLRDWNRKTCEFYFWCSLYEFDCYNIIHWEEPPPRHSGSNSPILSLNARSRLSFTRPVTLEPTMNEGRTADHDGFCFHNSAGASTS